MIQVICDFCNKEDKGDMFRCQLDVAELMTDLQTGVKAPKKDMYHCCLECYNKLIRPNIYDRSKKEKSTK